MNFFNRDSDGSSSLFDVEREKTPFFSRLDWSAFWTATIISFLVYFFTLAPTVTLEDSGELAVAGDHLGVPHPPGYPLWTMISWCFARLFSWVTFRGQPTPAWSIALGGSAVFGAIAAGLTAMLISRSGADMLRDLRGGASKSPKFDAAVCWCGGVASSLLFAFSPVMWSQATICEVYALNAFFLMMVMLLTYKWMRRPTPGLLWITAFVFGLGLTNYQVLLLAMVPLVIVIFLRDLKLFRDFLLTAIPLLLTLWILQLGALLPTEGFPKHSPILSVANVYSPTLFFTGLAIACVGLVIAIVAFELSRRDNAASSDSSPATRPSGAAASQPGSAPSPATRPSGAAASQPGCCPFTGLHHSLAWTAIGAFGFGFLLMLASRFSQVEHLPAHELAAPLVDPRIYMGAATAFVGAIGACVAAGLLRGKIVDKSDPLAWLPIAAFAVLAIIVLVICGSVKPAPPYIPPPGQTPSPPFNWAIVVLGFLAATVVLFALACTTPTGLYYALGTTLANVALFLLLRRGALLGLTHPSTWWFWTPIALNFAYLALGWLFLPNGRTVSLTVLATELGVAFYAYMPIVSDLRNPPMNWGYPRTWEGFKHAITREQYEKLAPTDIFSDRFMKQIGSYFTDLRTQFTLLVAPLGFLPFALWRIRVNASVPEGEAASPLGAPPPPSPSTPSGEAASPLGAPPPLSPSTPSGEAASPLGATSLRGRASSIRARHIAFFLFLLASFFVVLAIIPHVEVFFDASRLDKWLLAPVLLIAAIGGFLIAESQYSELVSSTFRRRSATETLTLAFTILGLAGAIALFVMKGVYAAFEEDDPAIRAAQNLSLIRIAAALIAVAVVAAVIAGPLLVRRYAPSVRNSVEFGVDHVNQQWLIATVAAFLMMSVLLTVLANPKGDLQDAFIQKVKFISSHGLFAIWIGYGAIFALLTLDELLERAGRDLRGLARTISVAAVCVLPLIPIHQNYFNERLVFELGGAEQNGHDYGWQFGNFQLRGAEAILEELEFDEEPLPNPYYPEAMTTNAVFFGGTDPGRFVPTYMIYSALVRPDVFIITQNALADNTYMSVERDLYGDDMWIPTPEDSAKAFQIYVDEVESGKRPRNAELVIDHGRVQVSGALGVMEINGILCDMMFKRNKALHDFYVEESYVIPWMYPYLTPHGLILKLNSEKTNITKENTAADMDFWDWYSRRLVYSKNFRRDVVAQKSFSKLRSAIAGCYASRGRIAEAEQAFAEARFLYKVSPEAIFRVAQDIHMRSRRYDDAIDMLEEFLKDDKNNERAKSFKDYLVKIRDCEARIGALAAQVKPGEQPPPGVLIGMAECYADMGSDGMVSRCVGQALTATNLPPETLVTAFSLAIDVDDFPLAARAADRIYASVNARTALSPELVLATVRAYNATRQHEKMGPPLMSLLKADPQEWRGWLFLGSFYAARGDKPHALEAFSHGLTLGGEGAKKLLEGDPVLREAFIAVRKAAAPATAPVGIGDR